MLVLALPYQSLGEGGFPVGRQGDDGQGAVVTLTDITERKTANARLRRSEERLSLALNASGMIGTWDWDLRDDVVGAAPPPLDEAAAWLDRLREGKP